MFVIFMQHKPQNGEAYGEAVASSELNEITSPEDGG